MEDLDNNLRNKGNVQPVILCGGKGSRLWPLSRGKVFLNNFYQ